MYDTTLNNIERKRSFLEPRGEKIHLNLFIKNCMKEKIVYFIPVFILN